MGLGQSKEGRIRPTFFDFQRTSIQAPCILEVCAPNEPSCFRGFQDQPSCGTERARARIPTDFVVTAGIIIALITSEICGLREFEKMMAKDLDKRE
jgi:hypothetical protein